MSLGILVGRFGAFVREAHVAAADDHQHVEFPNDLNVLREAVGHHLIPLMLLARSDGEFAPQECEVVVAHCIDQARRQGIEVDPGRAQLFSDYVATYRPTLMQLDPALARLSHSAHQEVLNLVCAAQAVIEADGVVRPEETKLLTELNEDLRDLLANS